MKYLSTRVGNLSGPSICLWDIPEPPFPPSPCSSLALHHILLGCFLFLLNSDNTFCLGERQGCVRLSKPACCTSLKICLCCCAYFCFWPCLPLAVWPPERCPEGNAALDLRKALHPCLSPSPVQFSQICISHPFMKSSGYNFCQLLPARALLFYDFLPGEFIRVNSSKLLYWMSFRRTLTSMST